MSEATSKRWSNIHNDGHSRSHIGDNYTCMYTPHAKNALQELLHPSHGLIYPKTLPTTIRPRYQEDLMQLTWKSMNERRANGEQVYLDGLHSLKSVIGDRRSKRLTGTLSSGYSSQAIPQGLLSGFKLATESSGSAESQRRASRL